MRRITGGGAFAAGFSLLFFGFLFGPLIIMMITAFNSSAFPRVTPWECFTTDWFAVLVDNQRLMSGLVTSVAIGIGVVLVSLPVGLAGALALSEIGPRLRSALYAVLITPILIPGVVLGISTIVFWGGMARTLGIDYGTGFYNGSFLTLLGQATFISAYAMLIFMARLQRFDATLTEAALDLGATPGQAFRRIMLPFLKPAIGSAAFLVLLASFENYNTTVFTILSDNTFTTALASKVRHGTDPSLSALAVIIIGLTLIGAMVHEAHTRRQQLLRTGRPHISRLYANPVSRALTHPAGVAAVLVLLAAGLVWQGSRHDSTACVAEITLQKRLLQEQLLEQQRRALPPPAPASAPASSGGAASGNPSPFGGAFGGGLRPGSETLPPPASSGGSAPNNPSGNPSPFGGAFGGDSLRPGAARP
ncbi:MAG: ABC transporter permease [Alphaproteobacteria bacterium]|nr:ABC transporter permease [Alphaproteobacteria bacterium]MBU0797690.1 ABC transporter permease [Alphaproteobacteria bacterium]MBU0888375.1 ABC transporter permease [Alphaproteobacteria bacterium]MBU1814686.1 ABC transporter permease [Alphaproteobacteria bacterium]MBU2092251.1 ABC transporter permease [Alphaproteobacteria bacterium]